MGSDQEELAIGPQPACSLLRRLCCSSCSVQFDRHMQHSQANASQLRCTLSASCTRLCTALLDSNLFLPSTQSAKPSLSLS